MVPDIMEIYSANRLHFLKNIFKACVVLILVLLVSSEANVIPNAFSPMDIPSPDGRWKLMRLDGNPLEKSWID